MANPSITQTTSEIPEPHGERSVAGTLWEFQGDRLVDEGQAWCGEAPERYPADGGTPQWARVAPRRPAVTSSTSFSSGRVL